MILTVREMNAALTFIRNPNFKTKLLERYPQQKEEFPILENFLETTIQNCLKNKISELELPKSNNLVYLIQYFAKISEGLANKKSLAYFYMQKTGIN